MWNTELITGKGTRAAQNLSNTLTAYLALNLCQVQAQSQSVCLVPLGPQDCAQTYPSGLLAGELGFTGLVGDGRPCFSMVSLTSSYAPWERKGETGREGLHFCAKGRGFSPTLVSIGFP